MLGLKNRVAGISDRPDRTIQWGNTPERFGLRAQLYHCVMAIAILVMLVVGMTMEHWPSEWRGLAFVGHKGLGLWILFAGLVWIIHYLFQLTPEQLPTQIRPAYRLAKLVHRVLLLLCVIMPLSGWAMVSAWGGKPVTIAPGIQLPPIAAKDPSFAKAMQGVHIVLAWVLIGLIVLHIAAALYHHFVVRDPILKRMIPRFAAPKDYYRFQFDKGVRRSKKLR